MARPAGFEPATLGLAYHYSFRYPAIHRFDGLDYLFTISGVARIVSTEPFDNQRPNVHLYSDYSSALLPSK